jgi:hypothetical protein
MNWFGTSRHFRVCHRRFSVQKDRIFASYLKLRPVHSKGSAPTAGSQRKSIIRAACRNGNMLRRTARMTCFLRVRQEVGLSDHTVLRTQLQWPVTASKTAFVCSESLSPACEPRLRGRELCLAEGESLHSALKRRATTHDDAIRLPVSTSSLCWQFPGIASQSS